MKDALPIQPLGRTRETPVVLCIDDDPNVSVAIEIYMRRYDVKVTRAFHGMQGLAEAIHSRPDVIVMDLSMPNGDGCAILESLRRNRGTAAIPVIILSGSRDERRVRTATALGANRFVAKPARLEDLISEIGQFVELRMRADENGDS